MKRRLMIALMFSKGKPLSKIVEECRGYFAFCRSCFHPSSIQSCHLQGANCDAKSRSTRDYDCSKRFGTTTASAFSEMPTENCLSQTTILGAPKAILIALIMFFFSSQNARRVVAASNSLRKSQWQGSASGVLENLRLFVPVGPMAEESCKKNLNHRGKKYRICWTEPKQVFHLEHSPIKPISL